MPAHAPPLPEKVLEPGPWMTMNQIAKTIRADGCRDGEYPPQRPRALVVAGSAAHEDPGVVEAAQDAQGHRTAARTGR